MAKRRWFAVLGVFVVVGWFALLPAFLAEFDFSVLDAVAALSLAFAMLAGVLFAFGGLSVQLGNLEWFQCIGTGWILMGIWFGVFWSVRALRDIPLDNAEGLFVVFGVVGGLSFVFTGVDWIRGGHRFEISQYEAGPIFVSTGRNQT